MSKRRPLTAGVNVVPDADPEAVRQFVTQERKPQPEKESGTGIVRGGTNSAGHANTHFG